MNQPQPLWSADNFTMFSDVFSVPAGKICILFAAGLERDRVKTSTSEFSGKQAVCVRRMLYAPDLVFGKNATCDWVALSTSATKIADERVQTCGRCWMLTESHNIGIIGVPGIYRLELNDATAIHDAQVYAELLDADAVPVHAKELFFL